MPEMCHKPVSDLFFLLISGLWVLGLWLRGGHGGIAGGGGRRKSQGWMGSGFMGPRVLGCGSLVVGSWWSWGNRGGWREKKIAGGGGRRKSQGWMSSGFMGAGVLGCGFVVVMGESQGVEGEEYRRGG
ncbi:Hypothetical predicted protein [Prunus dulcis]|uniref:Uncharacterized protein n=1 Tax=Prunus dulcis TaxID=3755 RepID=A0A5E4GDA6_PRUDU|nr:Hypothetical predicted protein [Prunus dulcis]